MPRASVFFSFEFEYITESMMVAIQRGKKVLVEWYKNASKEYAPEYSGSY